MSSRDHDSKAWCGPPVVPGHSEEGGGLCSQQQEPCSPLHTLSSVSLRQKHGTATAPHGLQPPLSPVQGYKMDDLLTSYVQQLLSSVNKQRGSQAPALADP